MSAEQSAVLEDLKRQAESDAGPAKEGEYIPRGEQAREAKPEASPEVGTADVLRMLLSSAFSILAPAWDVSDVEIEALAQSNGAAIDAWFPDGFLNGKWGATLAAVSVTVGVIGPRLKAPRTAPAAPEEPPHPADNGP